MNVSELIQRISAKDADIDEFVQRSIREEDTRNEIIKQMVTNPNIMVYYHCYYVVAKASQARPDLFYRYWPEIASLLRHKNSYHRDIALTVLANLTQADQECLFEGIYQEYFEHVNDDRFMTGKCCIKNSRKIFRHKPELRNQILALLLNIDYRCTYTDKQKAVLKADILEILDEVYAEVGDKKEIDEFIKAAASSISPKTRHKGKELVKKYGL